MDEIVFLDVSTVGTVENIKLFKKLGKIDLFEHTEPNQVVERCMGKEIVITNKLAITADVMDQLPDLKLICIAATGMNNIDLDHATKKGIQVKNVVSYSTDSVAQVTFTMLLHLVNRPFYYDHYVKSGAYAKSKSFTHHAEPFWELRGKRMGIIGLGTIGRQVARIAEAFGMEVVFYSTTGRNNNINYKRFELDDLLKKSDVVTIHAPLNEKTRGLITYEKMKLMRPCAILLNLGRGGIVDEHDLARALNENILGGVGLDVFEKEPIQPDNPLLKLYDKEKLIITPHMAWASKEARELLLRKIAQNIESYQKGREE
ncbi:MAG: D-2-hydroxyacid dehydrogenase [Bacteroidales bacterium]|nr:D-2-hydroxyacid dehydrogenase [Bacteroidales bacterium]MDT8431748.1 D-2-hydroxyacid dehydrogenase [Bacteroidales bacterium]